MLLHNHFIDTGKSKIKVRIPFIIEEVIQFLRENFIIQMVLYYFF